MTTKTAIRTVSSVELADVAKMGLFALSILALLVTAFCFLKLPGVMQEAAARTEATRHVLDARGVVATPKGDADLLAVPTASDAIIASCRLGSGSLVLSSGTKVTEGVLVTVQSAARPAGNGSVCPMGAAVVRSPEQWEAAAPAIERTAELRKAVANAIPVR